MTIQEQYEPTLLFHQDKFILSRSGAFIVTVEGRGATCSIAFEKVGDSLISLHKSSFGGFSGSGSSSPELLSKLIQRIRQEALQRKCSRIQIRSYPSVYAGERWSIMDQSLAAHGFMRETEDTNQHIMITDASFSKLVHAAERRYINRGEKEKWQFVLLEPARWLEECHTLLKVNRLRKQYPMTMNLDELKVMFSRFPEEYLLFGLFRKNKLIAANVSIRLNKDILYDFYHGESKGMQKMSPVVFLIANLYSYCQKEGIHLLDLGVSSDKGKLNKGLFTFKKNLGGEPSRKRTYSKQIEL